jgi:hypothetical protein
MDESNSDSEAWYICKYCKKNYKGRVKLNSHKKQKHVAEIRAAVALRQGNVDHINSVAATTSESLSSTASTGLLNQQRKLVSEPNEIPEKRYDFDGLFYMQFGFPITNKIII